MTTEAPTTATTAKNQSKKKDQEPSPLPDTDHYAEQTSRDEQQDRRTKGSRERSRAAHLCITIPGHGPASGRLEPHRWRAARFLDLQRRPVALRRRSSEC